MITENRIKAIEDRLDELQNAFIQSQKNQIPITAKTDKSAIRIIEMDQKIDETVNALIPLWNPSNFSYFAGEKVLYNGKYYRCIQAHTSQEAWNPEDAASLWAEIGNPSEEWPEWIQPTGAHNAYAKGDKVSHNEKHWISDIDANVFEPGVSSWTEQ